MAYDKGGSKGHKGGIKEGIGKGSGGAVDPTKGAVPLQKKSNAMDFMSDGELKPNKTSGSRSF